MERLPDALVVHIARTDAAIALSLRACCRELRTVVDSHVRSPPRQELADVLLRSTPRDFDCEAEVQRLTARYPTLVSHAICFLWFRLYDVNGARFVPRHDATRCDALILGSSRPCGRRVSRRSPHPHMCTLHFTYVSERVRWALGQKRTWNSRSPFPVVSYRDPSRVE